MKFLAVFSFAFMLLAACSETNIDDLDEAGLNQIDKQIEADARTLEEAADQAVKILEEDIQAELNDEGIVSQQDSQNESDVTEESSEQ